MHAEANEAYNHFASQLGVLVPETLLPANSNVALVKVASRRVHCYLCRDKSFVASPKYATFCCRLIGMHAWPITEHFVSSLHEVSKKLSHAMHANCTTELLPSPLAYTSTRGLGLNEGKHLSGALIQPDRVAAKLTLKKRFA